MLRGDLRSWWRRSDSQGSSIPTPLEAPDLQLHVVEGTFEVGAPLLNRGHSHLQRGQPVAAVAVQLPQPDQLEVAHAVLHILDPLLDLAAPIVGDDGGVGLFAAEALQHVDAIADGRPELLQPPDLVRGVLRLVGHRLLQVCDAVLHGGTLLLALLLAVGGRLLPSPAALID